MVLACPVCKLLQLRRGLCDACAGHLWRRRAHVTRREDGFVTRSLFSWERDGWPGLRWWVHALKGTERDEFWREPALWALATFPRPPEGTCLVPVPSARPHNHARGFARALARRTGWPVAEPLRVLSAREQKDLSAADRAGRAFAKVSGDSYTHVLLIDDVVTTGATCRAAWAALAPGTCEAWCLLDRRPCGASHPLL